MQYRKPNKKGKRTFAVAERHYQKTDDGRLFKDKIYVSLHLESSPEDEPASERWVVDEIKSIRWTDLSSLIFPFVFPDHISHAPAKTRDMIAMKDEVESMREQIQNLE